MHRYTFDFVMASDFEVPEDVDLNPEEINHEDFDFDELYDECEDGGDWYSVYPEEIQELMRTHGNPKHGPRDLEFNTELAEMLLVCKCPAFSICYENLCLDYAVIQDYEWEYVPELYNAGYVDFGCGPVKSR